MMVARSHPQAADCPGHRSINPSAAPTPAKDRNIFGQRYSNDGPAPSRRSNPTLVAGPGNEENGDLITTYRESTTASPGHCPQLSHKNVKRLPRTASIDRTSPPQRTTKATPGTTHP